MGATELASRARDEDRGAADVNVNDGDDDVDDGGGLLRQGRVLAIITVAVATPYALYLFYLWLVLQSGVFGPESTVALGDARQLLVVGTQSSGTTQMSASLRAIGMEVAHESSETQWEFARDGTISWFHGIRFLPRSSSSLRESVGYICRGPIRNVGFHPSLYRTPRRGCSYRVLWDECWAHECTDLLSREWGCAYDATCETPFATSLLQARHPLRTVESLVTKFCTSLDAASPASDAWMGLLRALFPGEAHWGGSCVAVHAWYVVRYMEGMLAAMTSGLIDGAYQVESTARTKVRTSPLASTDVT